MSVELTTSLQDKNIRLHKENIALRTKIRELGYKAETICPFCKESDFDLIGLKIHFTWCDKYQELG